MNRRLSEFLNRLPVPSSTEAALYTRVLIRRGLDGHPFPSRASDESASATASLAEKAFKDTAQFDILHLTEFSTLDRRVVVERDLVPQSYAIQGNGFLALNKELPVWCSINETDHIRIRAEYPGGDVRGVYQLATEVEERIGETLDYAFTPETGYICAELADWGTGVSASTTLHLPALAMAGFVDRALRSALETGLSVRGFWSDESASSGALYELETPHDIGGDELSLLNRLGDAVERMAAYERGARDELLAKDAVTVRDAVYRAYGVARYALRIGYDEGAETLSRLRLGASAGILGGFDGAAGALGFYSLRNAQLLRGLGADIALDETASEGRRLEELRAKALRTLVSNVSILEVP